MAEKETKNNPKDLIEATPEEVILVEKPIDTVRVFKRMDREERDKEDRKNKLASWIPKTKLGIAVKAGKEKNIDNVLKHSKKILESEIVDSLLNLESEAILIGQAKGKFGGGKRRAWRQTQKKTQEGNVLTFSSMIAVGDKKGHIGLGFGKSKETLPSREKALRQAKLNLIKIQRGFEDPLDALKDDPHTVPFKVSGKCGSCKITIIPAPRGTGLAVADECKKILRLAGIRDVYSVTKGSTRTTFNLVRACLNALRKTSEE